MGQTHELGVITARDDFRATVRNGFFPLDAWVLAPPLGRAECGDLRSSTPPPLRVLGVEELDLASVGTRRGGHTGEEVDELMRAEDVVIRKRGLWAALGWLAKVRVAGVEAM